MKKADRATRTPRHAPGLPDLLADIPPDEQLRSVVFMTYGWDGDLVAERILPVIDRPADHLVVIRDARNILRETSDVHIHRIDLQLPAGVFHAKLALVVGEHSARAVIGSANLTPGGQCHNAELQRTFDLGRGTGNRQVFLDLVAIFERVSRDLVPHHAIALDRAATALQDVLRAASAEALGSTRVLTNHDRSLWDQVREIAQLDQRRIAMAHVVSPFFDANAPACPTDDARDAVGARDFLGRLRGDLGLAVGNVHIYTEESAAQHAHAILGDAAQDITWHLRDAAQDLPPLHGKMLLLAGDRASWDGAITIIGSANATRAAWLTSGQAGNTELIAVTTVERQGAVCVRAHLQQLGLDRDFSPGGPPPPALVTTPLTDPPWVPKLHVAAAVLDPDGTTCRVWLAGQPEVVVAADVAIGDGDPWPVQAPLTCTGPLPWTARIDALGVRDASGMRSLPGARVRVRLTDATGIVHQAEGSLCVAEPEAFAGLYMDGDLEGGLDMRMERDTALLRRTYRERRQDVVRRIDRQRSEGWRPPALLYQGDLDACFRRCRAALDSIRWEWGERPDALSVLIKSARRLISYLQDAITQPQGMSEEARLWLSTELCSAVLDLLATPDRRSSILKQIPDAQSTIAALAERHAAWLQQVDRPDIRPYTELARQQMRLLCTQTGASA
jgi:hypothetical protein